VVFSGIPAESRVLREPSFRPLRPGISLRWRRFSLFPRGPEARSKQGMQSRAQLIAWIGERARGGMRPPTRPAGAEDREGRTGSIFHMTSLRTRAVGGRRSDGCPCGRRHPGPGAAVRPLAWCRRRRARCGSTAGSGRHVAVGPTGAGPWRMAAEPVRGRVQPVASVPSSSAARPSSRFWKRSKKASAILRAKPPMIRPPSWASLPPTRASTV